MTLQGFHRQIYKACILVSVGFGFSACQTLPTPAPDTAPSVQTPAPDDGISDQADNLVPETELETDDVPVAEPDIIPDIIGDIYEDAFAALPHWARADMRPAIRAFVRSCKKWAAKDPAKALSSAQPRYGTYADWAQTCRGVKDVSARLSLDKIRARIFFETYFTPVALAAPGEDKPGLLTGYYEPEIPVRAKPDSVYFEPILTLPKNKSAQNRPRADITPDASQVIAYGRPIDVFFMQIQGSGRLRFKDGRSVRAAYGGNNGYKYYSIGRELIKRGELTRDQASKQAIEVWMKQAGPEAARDLMNTNKRYIYFTEETIRAGEGPKGAHRVPLTQLGSIAVDPRFHPYGSLVWLETRLPQKARDYKGKPTGLLSVAQDAGNAIKGAQRADLYFGAGDAAGARAGVMKHPVRMTLLLPKALAADLSAAEDIS